MPKLTDQRLIEIYGGPLDHARELYRQERAAAGRKGGSVSTAKGFATMAQDSRLAAQAKGGSTKPKKPRGFAAMSPERRKEIASRGGSASGGNFKHDPKRAALTGRKGGKVTSGSES